jgi:hypothetical protein
MAVLLLTAAASALTAGASAFVQIAAAAAATAVGSFIDNRLFGPSMGNTTQEGPRLDSLQVQASTEGAAIPEIAGRVRIAGQIIWATKFKEVATTTTQRSGGGKGGGGGGGSVTSTTYSYFANFAVGLCEGPIDRIGRIWADGKPLSLASITMRVYRGTANQSPDPLIEGVEGSGNAPAYRGTAYVVFDNLPLEKFGNRLPQLTFEVFRRVSSTAGDSLETIIRTVTLIPGAGERAYDTKVQKRDLGGGSTTPENDSTGRATPDWSVALDDLKASLPNVDTVFLVVGWFGDDLRCGSCTIRPKVEVANKVTIPDIWTVHGIARSDALIMSLNDGKPAYGGTPSDDTVVRAIRDLKARGYSVVFYPFVFMDVPTGNALPNPYGGSSQPVYPWRGRITCHPAAGQSGTVDKTAAAGTQVAAFFGSCLASHVTVSVNASTDAVTTSYSGPAEWGLRRFILHYAKLCAAVNAIDAGAIDAFLIGSEFRGLCSVRDRATNFPAVALRKIYDMFSVYSHNRGFAHMPDVIKHLLRQALSKDLLIDLEDGLRAEALKAFEVVRDHTTLNKKRARESEGQLRFRMMEQRFEAICILHGWCLLDGGVIPNTKLRVFQPFVRLEIGRKGIIFGLAAMPEPRKIPAKNMSRLSGVTVNYQLSPRLDFDGSGPKNGDIFVLLLVSRHREKAGQIEEIAVGVIDSKYESFLFYETLTTFLSGHSDVPIPSAGPTLPTTPPAAAIVALKKRAIPFVPPEAPQPDKKEGTGTE